MFSRQRAGRIQPRFAFDLKVEALRNPFGPAERTPGKRSFSSPDQSPESLAHFCRPRFEKKPLI